MSEIVSWRRLKLAVVLATTVAIVSISTSPGAVVWAAGADNTASAATEAKRHYEEGTKAFNLGEFARAIAEFKAAYNAKPDPLLLYNIAQSYRLGGDAGQALFFYKSFLRNMPAAPNRKDVEALIRRLERQVEDQKREPAVVTLPPASGAASGTLAPPPPSSAWAPPSATGPGAAPPAARAVAPDPASSRSIAAPPPLAPAPPPLGPAPGGSPITQVDLTAPTQTQPAEESDRPIYKKWWFWAGAVGAVAIIGGLAAANAQKAPETALGTFEPAFKCVPPGCVP